jgi:hypothetical protein
VRPFARAPGPCGPAANDAENYTIFAKMRISIPSMVLTSVFHPGQPLFRLEG